MHMRRATHDDVPLIARWRDDAAQWLNTKGTDQWSNAGITRNEFEKRVHESIQEGGTWIAESDDGEPMATIAIDDHEDDPGLWQPDLLRKSLVIHRMIVARSYTGQDIGGFMLDHAGSIAWSMGKTRLLLDAWTTNHELHDYYRAHGFSYIGTVAGHSTASAALFARTVSQP
jgi:GNAT superfamily N-acetyltransferase